MTELPFGCILMLPLISQVFALKFEKSHNGLSRSTLSNAEKWTTVSGAEKIKQDGYIWHCLIVNVQNTHQSN
jgi:hypothetical protein